MADSLVLVFTWGIAFATGKPSVMLNPSRRTWVFIALSGVPARLS